MEDINNKNNDSDMKQSYEVAAINGTPLLQARGMNAEGATKRYLDNRNAIEAETKKLFEDMENGEEAYLRYRRAYIQEDIANFEAVAKYEYAQVDHAKREAEKARIINDSRVYAESLNAAAAGDTAFIANENDKIASENNASIETYKLKMSEMQNRYSNNMKRISVIASQLANGKDDKGGRIDKAKLEAEKKALENDLIILRNSSEELTKNEQVRIENVKKRLDDISAREKATLEFRTQALTAWGRNLHKTIYESMLKEGHSKDVAYAEATAQTGKAMQGILSEIVARGNFGLADSIFKAYTSPDATFAPKTVEVVGKDGKKEFATMKDELGNIVYDRGTIDLSGRGFMTVEQVEDIRKQKDSMLAHAQKVADAHKKEIEEAQKRDADSIIAEAELVVGNYAKSPKYKETLNNLREKVKRLQATGYAECGQLLHKINSAEDEIERKKDAANKKIEEELKAAKKRVKDEAEESATIETETRLRDYDKLYKKYVAQSNTNWCVDMLSNGEDGESIKAHIDGDNLALIVATKAEALSPEGSELKKFWKQRMQLSKDKIQTERQVAVVKAMKHFGIKFLSNETGQIAGSREKNEVLNKAKIFNQLGVNPNAVEVDSQGNLVVKSSVPNVAGNDLTVYSYSVFDTNGMEHKGVLTGRQVQSLLNSALDFASRRTIALEKSKDGRMEASQEITNYVRALLLEQRNKNGIDGSIDFIHKTLMNNYDVGVYDLGLEGSGNSLPNERNEYFILGIGVDESSAKAMNTLGLN